MENRKWKMCSPSEEDDPFQEIGARKSGEKLYDAPAVTVLRLEIAI
jgi:hypothetical protein